MNHSSEIMWFQKKEEKKKREKMRKILWTRDDADASTALCHQGPRRHYWSTPGKMLCQSWSWVLVRLPLTSHKCLQGSRPPGSTCTPDGTWYPGATSLSSDVCYVLCRSDTDLQRTLMQTKVKHVKILIFSDKFTLNHKYVALCHADAATVCPLCSLFRFHSHTM